MPYSNTTQVCLALSFITESSHSIFKVETVSNRSLDTNMVLLQQPPDGGQLLNQHDTLHFSQQDVSPAFYQHGEELFRILQETL